MDTLLRVFFMFDDGRSHCSLNYHETESTVGDGFFIQYFFVYVCFGQPFTTCLRSTCLRGKNCKDPPCNTIRMYLASYFGLLTVRYQ